MKYIVTISDGKGRIIGFKSDSRNAKKHLRERVGTKNGAVCIIHTLSEKYVSACGYSDEFGFFYMNYQLKR